MKELYVVIIDGEFKYLDKWKEWVSPCCSGWVSTYILHGREFESNSEYHTIVVI